MKHIFALFLLLFQAVISFGQINLSKSLDSHLSAESIKENNIKSLVIYADFNENGIDKRGGYGGKLAEFEFDNNGCQNYKLTSNNHGNLPFVEYGRGSYMEISKHDDNSQITSSYTENYRKSTQEINTYDSKGRKVTAEFINNIDTVLRLAFVWEKDKMIRTNILYVNETNKNRINIYDENGRILKSSSDKWSTNYEYKQKDDTLNTTIVTYRSDTLFSTQEYSTLIKFNRIFRYVKRDYSEKLDIEMNVKFDENGNATYYYLNDLSQKYSGNIAYPPSHYKIENVYDNRDLLIKRVYYYSREDVGENIMTKIERYFYSKNELPFKITKGLLIEREELEMIDFNDK